MPFSLPYPDKGGFGGNSYLASSNPSPTSNPMGQYSTAAARVSMPTAPVSTPASTSSSLNVGASSRSLNPFGGFGTPDLSYADPNTLNRLNISNLIYSPSAGGYLRQGVNYSGLGSGFGGDPQANRQAGAFYNYIGSLPTQPAGSPALRLLNAASGVRGTGPSYNSQIQSFFNNAPQYVQDAAIGAGFNPNGYFGPSAFGRRNRGGY